MKPGAGSKVTVPSRLTVTTPSEAGGCVIPVITGLTKVPPMFPGPSFDKMFIITLVSNGVTELSFVATGGFVPNLGSTTVIVNNSVGQFGTTVGGTQTGTS